MVTPVGLQGERAVLSCIFELSTVQPVATSTKGGKAAHVVLFVFRRASRLPFREMNPMGKQGTYLAALSAIPRQTQEKALLAFLCR